MNLDELKSVRKCNDNVSENNKTWYSSSITLAQKGHIGWGGDEVQKTKRLLITNTTSGPWNLPWKVWRFKSAYTFLTLVYISSLSIFFTSFFFHYFLSLFLHSTKTLCRKRLCLIVPGVFRRIGESISLQSCSILSTSPAVVHSYSIKDLFWTE